MNFDKHAVSEAARVIREGTREIDSQDSPDATELDKAFHDYKTQYYGHHFSGSRSFWGILKFREYNIFVHIMVPISIDMREADDYILDIHGYNGHAADHKNIQQILLREEKIVVTFDLFGHGLSSGKRFVVRDFEDYEDCIMFVRDQVNRFLGKLVTPSVVAHSTGGAAIIEILIKNPLAFKKVCLLSPLFRPAGHPFPRIFEPLYFFVDTIDFSKVSSWKYSSNRGYNEFAKFEDPLQENGVFSPSFIHANYKWARRMRKYETTKREVLIIQGDSDDVVAWRYNVVEIGRVLNVNMRIIKGANHQLFWEPEPMKRIFESYLFEGLELK